MRSPNSSTNIPLLTMMTQAWQAMWRCPVALWGLAGLGALCWQVGEGATKALLVHLLGLAYAKGLLAPLFASASQLHEAAGALLWMILRNSGILEASTYPMGHQLLTLLGDGALLVLTAWLALLTLMGLLSRLMQRGVPWSQAARVATWSVAASLGGALCLLLPGLVLLVATLPAVTLVCGGSLDAAQSWRVGLALGWSRLGGLSILVGLPLSMPMVVAMLAEAMTMAWPLGIGVEVISWGAQLVALLWLAQILVRFVASYEVGPYPDKNERSVAEVAASSSKKPM